MSRLRQQLAKLDAWETQKKQAAAVQEQLTDSGDAFELAARCAEGAWNARTPTEFAAKLSDSVVANARLSFELGYRVACAELAIILRAMRKGTPPSKAELAEAWNKVEAEIKEEN